jgi:6-phosphofructokinase 1
MDDEEGGSSLYKQRLLEPPHLRDYIGQALAVRVSPLLHSPYFHTTEGFWLTASDVVAQNVAMDLQDPASRTQAYFPRAGPRYQVVYEPDDVCAAIVTCGGLCPGLNAVVRELVDALWYQYGVKRIHGICGGYRGFYSRDTVPLHPRLVDGWHRIGGSRLGTSRGGFDLAKIVDSIEHRGFNHVYIIGGDGTMRGAVAVFREVQRRGLMASIVGIPKTVDNDVGIIDWYAYFVLGIICVIDRFGIVCV